MRPGLNQLSIFDDAPRNHSIPEDLLDYRPGVFSAAGNKFYLEKFIAEIPWEQRVVSMYGKEVITPRLTAWYGDPAVDSFSDSPTHPLPWTTELLEIKRRVGSLSEHSFNCVLLNYYRDGNDSVSWHSDNDGRPGKNRIVASVSFGQSRRFDVRNARDHSQKYSIELESGSYLLMQGSFQDEWEHRIAKSPKPLGPRVNLTFRRLP